MPYQIRTLLIVLAFSASAFGAARSQDFCKDMVEIYNRGESGWSDWRGVGEAGDDTWRSTFLPAGSSSCLIDETHYSYTLRCYWHYEVHESAQAVEQARQMADEIETCLGSGNVSSEDKEDYTSEVSAHAKLRSTQLWSRRIIQFKSPMQTYISVTKFVYEARKRPGSANIDLTVQYKRASP